VLKVDINDKLKNVHAAAKEKGFWDTEERILNKCQVILDPEDLEVLKMVFKAQRIALIHSEVSEVLEGLRSGVNNAPEEIADIIIRCNDYAGGYKIDLEKAISDKIDKNRKRPYKHNKLF
jgi:NTP pyrophosphatase (non-canonical NTP hydrolase)